jgi:hypothetical protein
MKSYFQPFLFIALLLGIIFLNLTVVSNARADCYVCDNYELRLAGDPKDCDKAPDCPELKSGNNSCNSDQNFSGQSCGITAESKEEKAVYNFNQALLPAEAIKKPDNKQDVAGWFTQIIKTIFSIFNRAQLFYDPIKDGGKLYVQSDSISKSTLPDQVRPDPAITPSQLVPNEAGYLGRNDNENGNDVGFYRSSIPSFDSDCFKKQDVKNCEKLYNQSYYPTGIPIVVPDQAFR